MKIRRPMFLPTVPKCSGQPVVRTTEITSEDKHRIQMQIPSRRWNASQIIPGLWLGSEEDAINVQALRENRITVRISVINKSMDPVEGIHQHTYSMEDRVGDDSLSRHLPNAMRVIAYSLSAGTNVLVHCHAGVSRSASMVIAFLMLVYPPRTFSCYGEPELSDRVMSAVKTKRDKIYPNIGFLLTLQDIARVWDTARQEVPDDDQRRHKPWIFSGSPLIDWDGAGLPGSNFSMNRPI